MLSLVIFFIIEKFYLINILYHPILFYLTPHIRQVLTNTSLHWRLWKLWSYDFQNGLLFLGRTSFQLQICQILSRRTSTYVTPHNLPQLIVNLQDYIPGKLDLRNYKDELRSIHNRHVKDKYDYKTPIYVHPPRKPYVINRKHMAYTEILQQYGVIDSLLKAQGDKSKKSRKKISDEIMNKLEETYWANWKPTKEQFEDRPKVRWTEPKKEERKKKSKSKTHPPQNSTEVQTDLSSTTSKIRFKEPSLKDTSSDVTQKEETNVQTIVEEAEPNPSCSDNLISHGSSNSLRHTDSLLLLKKKQSEIKVKVEQPRCLKLFRKSKSDSASYGKCYTRGGSYPLRSCIKAGKTGASFVLSTGKMKNN